MLAPAFRWTCWRACPRVLEYLSRYTHRTDISNERIHAISTEKVAFSVRTMPQGGKRLERMPGVEFVRRQAGLTDATAQSPGHESTLGFMARVARMDVNLCPCCKVGRLQVTAVLQGQARLPVPTCAVAQQSRGRREVWACAWFGIAAQEAGGGAARCVGQTRLGQRDTHSQRRVARVLCPFVTMLTDWNHRKPGHNLIQQMG